ncbi:hypothetical protein SAMN04487911_1297 [Arenibacter nanhaiticus]|uniref:Uncharacterized protein n=1 Tax=Arenibacter nanhaiticus TaxID=558155 RepID=A0A1M6L1E1_9FLAO|nr:hypothetical protein [Arenibacter nanhaiticus]SHJ64944.1 hypothetical protein SAMN04487911_1297 [Arenibacter nanhaiticus]
MENQVENTVQKVFVFVNQVWHKGEAVSTDDATFKIKTINHPPFEMSIDSIHVEVRKTKDQQFAMADAKRRLEGAYISFEKLAHNIQENILEGKEALITTTYIKDGKLKETVKMVQMLYHPIYGSKLDVQIKRTEPVKWKEANAYGYQFTKEEYHAMVQEGKTVLFTGSSLDGETFQKLAYYEPKLNNIRTKSTVSANMYVLGQQLTASQAEKLNQGKEVHITIRKTQKGPLTYRVRWSAKSQRFLYRNCEPIEQQKTTMSTPAETKKNQLNNTLNG